MSKLAECFRNSEEDNILYSKKKKKKKSPSPIGRGVVKNITKLTTSGVDKKYFGSNRLRTAGEHLDLLTGK